MQREAMSGHVASSAAAVVMLPDAMSCRSRLSVGTREAGAAPPRR